MKKHKKLDKLELLVSKYINDFPVGGHRSLFRGWGGDFDVVRPWQPGDKRISAPATIKMGELMAKVFQEPKEMRLWLLIDASHSMFFGSDIARREAAAVLLMILSYLAVNMGDLFGVILFDSEIRKFIHLTRDESNSRMGAEFLLNYQAPIEATNLSDPLEQLVSGNLQNTLVIIISDFCFSLEEKSIDLMKQISVCSGVSLLSLVLYDGRENEFAPHRFMADVRDAENDESLSWDLSSRSMAVSANEYLEEWRSELMSNLKQAGSDNLFLDISGGYIRELACYFAKKSQYKV